MTDDATLSEFATESDDEREAADDGSRRSGERDPDALEVDSRSPTSTIETASTYAWGEYTCTRCEAETDRVWRDDGAFVCPDCKSW